MQRARLRPLRSFLSALAAVFAAAPAAVPQDGLPPGVSREQMWFAPKVEDWARPCLIQWQRSWEDAAALSRRTGKAILLCVNMDGEIASEHWAGIRYRQPEIARHFEPYVCVIASVYRHNPRDYDDAGERIPCPRFGTVTCGEHIWIEPKLFERYFKDNRVAPRHIMVELDGSEVYDVYYAWDIDSVVEAVRAGIEQRASQPPAPPRGDRSLAELLASTDARDRAQVEAAWREGGAAQRRELIDTAAGLGPDAPVDLLRLAIYDLDLDLSRQALRILSESRAEQAVGLIDDVLRGPIEPAAREPLLAALERLGESVPLARPLAVVHRGLGQRSTRLDVDGWSRALDGAEAPPPLDRDAALARVDYAGEAARTRPEDPEASLQAAEALLAYAVDPATARALAGDRRYGPKHLRLLFEDVRRAGLAAEQAGAEGWRLDTVLALAAHYLGEPAEALARAERAIPSIPPGDASWNSIAVLAVFAGQRQQAILEAARANRAWPPEWLSDVHAAYSVIERHPLCGEAQIQDHYDFLVRLRAGEAAARALAAGLERFPESWGLHDRLRRRILAERGVEGLEAAYAERLARPEAHPRLAWFAGYASIVAAEHERMRNRPGAADAAYERALAHYDAVVARDPATAESSATYQALALAGRARVALEGGALAGALDLLLASFDRAPRAAATLDGLGISAVGTARSLLASYEEQGDTGGAARVREALERLREVDPTLLELPAFERGGPARN